MDILSTRTNHITPIKFTADLSLLPFSPSQGPSQSHNPPYFLTSDQFIQFSCPSNMIISTFSLCCLHSILPLTNCNLQKEKHSNSWLFMGLNNKHFSCSFDVSIPTVLEATLRVRNYYSLLQPRIRL